MGNVKGSCIEICIDMDTRCLSFSVNGANHADAGVALPPHVQPFVTLAAVDIAASLRVSGCSIRTKDSRSTDPAFRAEQPSFLITIKTITGKSIPLDVSAADCIEDVKEKLTETEGVLCNEQRLIWEGKELENDRMLLDCGIGKDATLFMVLRCADEQDSEDQELLVRD